MNRMMTLWIAMNAAVWACAVDVETSRARELLAFENDSVDLGEVSPGGRYEGAFRYRCLSSKPVNAQLLTATCHCWFLETGDLFLQPGMTGVIPANDEGYIHFRIDAPESGVIDDYFNIKVFVDGIERVYRLYIKGRVQEALDVPKGGLAFDLAQSPDIKTKRLDLAEKAGHDIKITEILISPQVLKIKRVGELGLEISVTDDVFQNPGETTWIEMRIRYKAEGDRTLERIVPITVRVPNPCDVSPNPVFFGRVSKPFDRVATAQLTYEGDFQLTKVAYAPEWTAVHFGKIPGRQAYALYLELKQAPPDHRFKDYVLIETNRAHRPVKVRFVGNYTQWPD